ncbi:DUF4241 domain-containing protein [Amycolatopsis sp. lyj-90]|uniref:DUF4241 domain-containing protein n=1 Tax=Amycolatopsis sp. lyj-90 TaxID=2789285 RepID=UPI00397AC63D
MGVRAKLAIGLVVLALVATCAGIAVFSARPVAAPVPKDVSCDPKPVQAVVFAQPAEPAPPLRRDGFDELFRTGREVLAGKEPAVVEVVELGALDLPSGRVLGGDPTTINDLTEPPVPFVVRVPPGAYPVSVAKVRIAGPTEHLRVAAARLTIRPEPVTRWELALVKGEDPAELGPNEFYGYGVDAGLGAFVDADAVPALCRLVGEDLEGPLIKALDGPEAALVRDPVSGLNVSAFGSGWGDGSYPTWIGYTAKGDVARFVTDFHVIS